MADYFKDSYYFNTNDHAEFLKELQEFDRSRNFEAVPLKEVSFVPASSITAAELDIGGEDEYRDTLGSELPLCARIDTDAGPRYICVRPYLYKFIKQHHGDQAAVLATMVRQRKFEDVCAHLNMGRKYLTKNALALTRNGKISGWFTEFNYNWSVSDQLEFLEDKMHAAFPDFAFEWGENSQYGIRTRYLLDSHIQSGIPSTVMSAYLDAWANAGMNNVADLSQAIPKLEFTTGESGLFAISVAPRLAVPGLSTIPLGTPMKVNHRGKDDAVWGVFEDFPNKVASLYQDGLKSMADLCNTPVSHPYHCMTHLLCEFRSTVPIKEMDDTLAYLTMEGYDPQETNGPVSAMYLYSKCVELVDRAIKSIPSPTRRLTCTETLGRILVANWKIYDKKTLGRYGYAKQSDEDDSGI